jgi:hypothetical protein
MPRLPLRPVPLNLLLPLLLAAALAACDAPAKQPAQSSTPAAPAPAAPAYALDTVRLRRADKAGLLTVQAAYPRLRPLPGTPPADTLGVGAFNRAAKKFAQGLVQEIEATARENRRDKLPTGLQVSFRAYGLTPGLASVGFQVEQDGIGPRPIAWATGLTYDLRTGRPLQPADLFEPSAGFRAAVLAELQPRLQGSADCELEPDNLAWDNFALGPDAYYLLLGDAQVGRSCETREVRVPLSRLQPFARPGSVLQRR